MHRDCNRGTQNLVCGIDNVKIPGFYFHQYIFHVCVASSKQSFSTELVVPPAQLAQSIASEWLLTRPRGGGGEVTRRCQTAHSSCAALQSASAAIKSATPARALGFRQRHFSQAANPAETLHSLTATGGHLQRTERYGDRCIVWR